VSAGTADPHMRFRLACSKRLKYLQAGFICAAGSAIWLVAAPRLGVWFAAGTAGLTVVWLAWRVCLADLQAPCALVAQAAGDVSLRSGTRVARTLQLAGYVQWPGFLVLELAPATGRRESVLVMSDALDPTQFRALAAWGRRHGKRAAVRF
jgi:hypothetical protein